MPIPMRRLLARQPRSPRRRSTSTVTDGAADARPAADALAPQGVELERDGAAAGFGIVGDVRCEGVRPFADFVIANEPDAPVPPTGRRAIPSWAPGAMMPSCIISPVHPNDRYRKSAGQHEQRQPGGFVDRRLQRAVVGARPAAAAYVLRSARQQRHQTASRR